jgi:hypothetical protein
MKGLYLMGTNKRIFFVFPTVLFMLVVFAGLPATSFSVEKIAGKDVKQQNNPYTKAEINIKIIPSINKTFGYDIFINGQRVIHQPHIPAVPGNKGFVTKARAQKVAEFVVKKIRNNEMPPAVTIDDLKKMGVLK